MDPERKLFKDWFDRQAAKQLAEQMARAWPDFPSRAFIQRATRDLQTLEFHARVKQLSEALNHALPPDPATALDILTRSLPPVLPDDQVTTGWLQWPLGQWIADHGLPCFEESMQAMTELTMRFSSEFAVRPFLETYPEKTFPYLLRMTRHKNHHVRRWCSEGARPRLPWGKRLHALVADPAPCWPILEALKDDPSPYVRKSVANHLNDIAKDHPAAVVERCREWIINASPERMWIIRHGLRTLIKAGNPDALLLLGYSPQATVDTSLAIAPQKLLIGGIATLTATLLNQGPKPHRYVVDYRIHFVRPTGRTSAKVFKWTTLELAGGEHAEIQKRHRFQPATIRSLHPGRHRIELLVNGNCVAEASLTLLHRDREGK
ncbi:MAG TPA: DNA alkylation repair protein [Kiritimatiellia bacterium]|nr:DNA alkylation repair protein [Kiritimatiellia bacterium]